MKRISTQEISVRFRRGASSLFFLLCIAELRVKAVIGVYLENKLKTNYYDANWNIFYCYHSCFCLV